MQEAEVTYTVKKKKIFLNRDNLLQNEFFEYLDTYIFLAYKYRIQDSGLRQKSCNPRQGSGFNMRQYVGGA